MDQNIMMPGRQLGTKMKKNYESVKKTFYLDIKYHKKNNNKIALTLDKKILKVNRHHFISIFYLFRVRNFYVPV